MHDLTNVYNTLVLAGDHHRASPIRQSREFTIRISGSRTLATLNQMLPRYTRLGRTGGSILGDMMTRSKGALVVVVDDDESVRESLEGLLTTLGHRVEVFATAEDFLISAALAKTDCLILDVRMPGMSGPDLQQELMRRQRNIPVIFITARGDQDTFARLIAAGAIDCLLKPFGEEAFLNAVSKALAR